MKYVSIYNSPIGILEITTDDDSVISVYLLRGENEEKTCEKRFGENDCIIECKKQLEEYFDGKLQKFELNIDIEKLEGTDFQKRVWKELLNIPYGKAWTYIDVARKIGNEKAVRAVANAIGKNPILIIVPCHRVIGSNGTLTGFGAGIENKAKLLTLEKIIWKENRKSLLKGKENEK